MRSAAIGLALVLVVVWFPNLDGRKLVRPDEGRYAEIAREMVATGDWLTPRLNGYKYFEKPPLQYWATAAAFTAFGIDEWTARLWTGLTGFLGVLLAWYVANRLRGPPAGPYAAAALAGTVYYAVLGHVNSLDMSLTFFLSAAVFAIAIAQQDGLGERDRRRWMLLAWAACAAATLTKGLIGIVLPAGAMVVYAVLERDPGLLKRLNLGRGLALFLVLTVPWFVAVSVANPEFVRFFFYQEHVERFLTHQHGRQGPLWYFVPVLVGGMLPWTLALLPATGAGWRADSAARFRPLRFLLVWAAVVFVFFSVSGSKLSSYILPLVPALAIVLGAALPAMSRRWLFAQAALCAAVGLGAALSLPSLAMQRARPGLPAELLAAAVPWGVAACCALVAGAAIAVLAESRGRRGPAVLAFAAGGLALAQLGLAAHGQLAPVYSAYHSVARIKNLVAADVPFYSVDTFDHSMVFYLGRTMTMVAYPDELEKSIQWTPEKYIPDLATFEQRWREDRDAFALLAPRDFAELERRGLPMKVVASDPRRVIVRKP